MAWRQLCWRLGFIAAVLLGGGLMFRRFDPDRHLSLIEATYNTWSLVFAQPIGGFPSSVPLRVMYFAVPVLGLTVIIEGIVELSMIVRDRRRYERSWCLMMASSMKDHIVLVGMGKLGYRTFRLLRRLGQSVVVIERDAACEFLDAVRTDGSALLIGDARHDRVLEEAGVAKARSIIIATNDDLANLEVALDARRMQPHIRVVLRMFDQNIADKVREGFDIQIAMSQSAMSAPAFALASIDRSIVSGYAVGDELVVMQRWSADAGGPFAGRTVGEAMSQIGLSVVEHAPHGGPRRLFPGPDVPIRPGDELLVQGPYEVLRRLRSRSTA